MYLLVHIPPPSSLQYGTCSVGTTKRRIETQHQVPSSEQSYGHFLYRFSAGGALRLFLVLCLVEDSPLGGFDAFRIAISDNRYPMAAYRVDLKLNGSGGPQKRAELERLEVCM